MDDPIKAKDAHSDTLRNKVNEWYGHTLLSRLDDKMYSVILVVMQRLHCHDLSGHLQSQPGYQLLSLPAIAPAAQNVAINAQSVHYRAAGSLLHPAMEGRKELAELRAQMGEAAFAAQYLQNPKIPEGQTFKAKWIECIPELPYDPGRHVWIVTIDTASAMTDTADYTAVVLMLASETGCFITRVWRQRMEYEQLKQLALQIHQKYAVEGRAELVFIPEYAGNGIALHHFLRSRQIISRRFVPTEDKQTRANQVVALVNARMLKLVGDPKKDAWIPALMEEITAFPGSRNDDQVDAVVMALYCAIGRFHYRYPVFELDESAMLDV